MYMYIHAHVHTCVHAGNFRESRTRRKEEGRGGGVPQILEVNRPMPSVGVTLTARFSAFYIIVFGLASTVIDLAHKYNA